MLSFRTCCCVLYHLLPWLALVLTFGCATAPNGENLDGFGFPGGLHDDFVHSASAGGTKDRLNTFAGRLAQGRMYEKSGQWEKARGVFESLIAEHPQRPEPYHRLGVVADHQRRHREAQAMLTEALRIDPRNASMLGDLGYCFFLQGKFAKAEPALVKATRLDPLNARTWNNLGMVYGHQDRFEEALQTFRRAGSEADAYYNLAFVFASQDRADQAKKLFKRALAIDPNHAKARKAFESFDRYEQSVLGDLEPTALAEDGGYYVPYVEGKSSSAVQNAAFAAGEEGSGGSVVQASLPAPRKARQMTRALHDRARALRKQGEAAP